VSCTTKPNANHFGQTDSPTLESRHWLSQCQPTQTNRKCHKATVFTVFGKVTQRMAQFKPSQLLKAKILPFSISISIFQIDSAQLHRTKLPPCPIKSFPFILCTNCVLCALGPEENSCPFWGRKDEVHK